MEDTTLSMKCLSKGMRCCIDCDHDVCISTRVQHTSTVLGLCPEQVRSELIEIVVAVVMEMLKRVHEKFSLQCSCLLPPSGR